MPISKQQGVMGKLSLFGCTLIWGSSFVLLKNTLESISPTYILAFRFTGAALLLFLIGLRELRKLNRTYIKNGLILGALLFVAYMLQTYGLYHTTPGKNAFLTTTYCIITPFLYWLISRRRPDRYNVSAAIICIAGCACVSLQENLTVGIGDLLTIACGLFYALHIIAISGTAPGSSTLLLTMLQFAVAAALSWIAAPFTGPMPMEISPDALLSILYLAVMCSAVCFFLQIYGQKVTPPSSAAVILTLESVFGALISVLFYHEQITAQLLIGFLLIFLSVLISETKLSFLKLMIKKPEVKASES